MSSSSGKRRSCTTDNGSGFGTFGLRESRRHSQELTKTHGEPQQVYNQTAPEMCFSTGWYKSPVRVAYRVREIFPIWGVHL
jgi:hypothetical protein